MGFGGSSGFQGLGFVHSVWDCYKLYTGQKRFEVLVAILGSVGLVAHLFWSHLGHRI